MNSYHNGWEESNDFSFKINIKYHFILFIWMNLNYITAT
jgi:hypothetical protein